MSRASSMSIHRCSVAAEEGARLVRKTTARPQALRTASARALPRDPLSAMRSERPTCLGVQVRVTMSTSCDGQTTNECPSGQSGAQVAAPMRPRTSASHRSTSGSPSFPRRKFSDCPNSQRPHRSRTSLSSSSVRSRSRLRSRGIAGRSAADPAATPRTVRTKLSTWSIAACSTPAAAAMVLTIDRALENTIAGERRLDVRLGGQAGKADEHLRRSVTHSFPCWNAGPAFGVKPCRPAKATNLT